MKKLIIAAFAVAFAAAAQAATVNWTVSKVYEPGTSTAAANYTAYLFQVSGTVTTDIITTAITANAFDTYASSALWSQKTSATGGISKTGLGNYTETSGTVSWFSVIFNSDTYANASKFIVTSTVSQTYTSSTGSKMATFANIGTNYQWADIAPEPTSGLLMLLGMGALALRRRRA